MSHTHCHPQSQCTVSPKHTRMHKLKFFPFPPMPMLALPSPPPILTAVLRCAVCLQEAHIQRLLARLDVILTGQGAATADIIGVQSEASMLPGWAAHKAHMELGMRLSQKQRCVGALRVWACEHVCVSLWGGRRVANQWLVWCLCCRLELSCCQAAAL